MFFGFHFFTSPQNGGKRFQMGPSAFGKERETGKAQYSDHRTSYSCILCGNCIALVWHAEVSDILNSGLTALTSLSAQAQSFPPTDIIVILADHDSVYADKFGLNSPLNYLFKGLSCGNEL